MAEDLVTWTCPRCDTAHTVAPVGQFVCPDCNIFGYDFAVGWPPPILPKAGEVMESDLPEPVDLEKPEDCGCTDEEWDLYASQFPMLALADIEQREQQKGV